ncbi:MAG TPA: zf-HC2 domain-containing protein [Thermoanaerobaculia bacterium]|nr:zf-HC2 domain-containing protein [Thermoanaerobaculia bacterium]
MTCEEAIAYLADYLDGLLEPDERARFERHLSLCESCTAYLAMYRDTIRMTRAAAAAPLLEAEEVPEDLVQAIVASVRG